MYYRWGITSNQRQIIEQATLTYFPFRKFLEKQIEKQVDVLRTLNCSNETHDLKRTEGIFRKNLLNHLLIMK